MAAEKFPHMHTAQIFTASCVRASLCSQGREEDLGDAHLGGSWSGQGETLFRNAKPAPASSSSRQVSCRQALRRLPADFRHLPETTGRFPPLAGRLPPLAGNYRQLPAGCRHLPKATGSLPAATGRLPPLAGSYQQLTGSYRQPPAAPLSFPRAATRNLCSSWTSSVRVVVMKTANLGGRNFFSPECVGLLNSEFGLLLRK